MKTAFTVLARGWNGEEAVQMFNGSRYPGILVMHEETGKNKRRYRR